jgi:putative sterol carrier protein
MFSLKTIRVTARVASLCALVAAGVGQAQETKPETGAPAGPVFMSAEWAVLACQAWNANKILTEELVTSGWVDNHKNRGFKVLQIYRTDCAESPRIEMRVSKRENKAACVYGGKVETTTLDSGADYIMHSQTAYWLEMGRGQYGPMRAMMFGTLKFDGPMFEAMGNMGPFKQFLLLPGKIAADSSTCPP